MMEDNGECESSTEQECDSTENTPEVDSELDAFSESSDSEDEDGDE